MFNDRPGPPLIFNSKQKAASTVFSGVGHIAVMRASESVAIFLRKLIEFIFFVIFVKIAVHRIHSLAPAQQVKG
jgi:hypothetical protein